MNTIMLGGTAVGDGHPPYIIAEIGSNHNGDMDLCRTADRRGGRRRRRRGQVPVVERVVAHRRRRSTTAIPSTRTRRSTSARCARWCRAYQLTPEQHVDRAGLLRGEGRRVLLQRLLARGGRSARLAGRALLQDRLHGRRQPAAARVRRRASGDRWSSPPAWRPWARSSGRSRRSAATGNDADRPAALRLHLSARLRHHPPAQHRDAARGLRRAGGLQRPHAGARRSPSPPSRSGRAIDREALHPGQGHGRAGTTPSRPTRPSCGPSSRRDGMSSTRSAAADARRDATPRSRSASVSAAASWPGAHSAAATCSTEDDLDGQASRAPASRRTRCGYVRRAETGRSTSRRTT